jgi:hypothetical protein
VRRTSQRQPKVLAVETATRSKKELPAHSLSYTQVPQTLGHTSSPMRSEDEGGTGSGRSHPRDPQWRMEQWPDDDET